MGFPSELVTLKARQIAEQEYRARQIRIDAEKQGIKATLLKVLALP